jgi:hypothetical protein
MALESLMQDKVDLLKQDGTRVGGLQASVQKGKIFTFAKEVISPNDLLIRTTSNGAEETYEVVDPVFYEQSGGIAAHYQIQVRKLGVPEAKQHVQSITYNVSGNGARVNHNSVDNSVNSITIDSDIQGNLETIRQEIEKSALPPEQRDEALEVVKELKEQFESGKPKKTIVSALVGALPSIATISKAVGAIAAAV